MKLPKPIKNIIDDFEKLPGIGPKTAQRLAFYLLKLPKDQVLKFSDDLKIFKEKIKLCEVCFNVGDESLCSICVDENRDRSTICVVESTLDILAIEKSGYRGLYHVLHGVINPLAGIGPDEIYLRQLFERVKTELCGKSAGINMGGIPSSHLVAGNKRSSGPLHLPTTNGPELILATGTSLEGEATSMYILRGIKALKLEVKVTRIGKGLPVGAEIEYADENTLNDAFNARIEYK